MVFLGVRPNTQLFCQSTLLDSINSKYDEQYPIITKDGKQMFFTRINHPDNIGGISDPGDIWTTKRNEANEWQKPTNIGWPLNDIQENSLISITLDKTFLYLNRHYSGNSNAKAKTNGISTSKLKNGKWLNTNTISLPYFKNLATRQSACMNTSQNIMFISAESFNTYGNEDIYISFKLKGEEWSSPENIGGKINTEFQELTPSLLYDSILIFSSNRHHGIGGHDLWLSYRLDSTWRNWSPPLNLGNNINTAGGEYSLFLDPLYLDKVFFISTSNSDGYGDISWANIPQILKPILSSDHLDSTEMNITVSDMKSGEKLNKVKLNMVIEGHSITTIKEYSLKNYSCLVPKNAHIIISCKRKGYLPQKITLLKAEKYLEIKLKPIEIGSTVRIENLIFDQGTAKIADSAYKSLDVVLTLMNDNPNLEIELTGHTDNRGSHKLNVHLSQKRVEVVKSFLITNGIDENRITGKGYGGSRPVASNDHEKSRKLNRRVEFIIKNINP